MIEEESSERMFRIILLSNQKRISLQAVFLLTNLLYEEMRNVNVGTMVFLGIMLMIFQIPTIIGEKEEGMDGNGK